MPIIGGKIEAFIFDLDGVLTDTAEYHYLAWKRLCEEEGLYFHRQINEKLRGVSRRKSLEIILGERKVHEKTMEEMMARKNRYYQQSIKKISKEDLLPGAEDILRQLKNKHIKLALGSSSKNARPVIARLEIEDYFDVVADGNSVERSKPAPDLFLYAAEKLGVSPSCCAVVEDAEAGIEAALTAGMLAVGIGPPDRVGKSHIYYPRISDLRIDDILSRG